MVIEKFRTGLWFLRRPSFWPHALALVGRKLPPGDNFGFRDFCRSQDVEFQVTESAGKFIGIARKV
jgi:hypothetical protein